MFCFSPSTVVSPALHSFLYRQWNKRSKLFHSISEMFLIFLTRKKLFEKNFSPRMCAKRRSASCNSRRGGNFGAKLTHLCGFWLDVSFFSHVKKHLSRFWLGVSFFFFTCENHSSLLWLARTHLRIKIYNTTFWWASMYIINLDMCKGSMQLNPVVAQQTSYPSKTCSSINLVCS